MPHLSHLSQPQATVLALWSFGVVLAQSYALSAVSSLLAAGMQCPEQTVRQQLREWYCDIQHKRGSKRQALCVETCFAPLLGWVVSWWQSMQLASDMHPSHRGVRQSRTWRALPTVVSHAAEDASGDASEAMVRLPIPAMVAQNSQGDDHVSPIPGLQAAWHRTPRAQALCFP